MLWINGSSYFIKISSRPERSKVLRHSLLGTASAMFMTESSAPAWTERKHLLYIKRQSTVRMSVHTGRWHQALFCDVMPRDFTDGCGERACSQGEEPFPLPTWAELEVFPGGVAAHAAFTLQEVSIGLSFFSPFNAACPFCYRTSRSFRFNVFILESRTAILRSAHRE